MQTLKIAVIGGGSSYTPELIEGIILRHQQIPVTELALVDVEAGREKVAIIAALTQRMLKRHGLEQVKVSVHFGLDEAIRGAQFVLTQLRVGQLAARAADERLGLKYQSGRDRDGGGEPLQQRENHRPVQRAHQYAAHDCRNAGRKRRGGPAELRRAESYGLGTQGDAGAGRGDQ